MFKADIHLTGAKELRKLTGLLPDQVLRRDMGKALRLASKPIINRAKSLAPRDSGLLRKSLGVKVVSYKNSGVTVAIIGPRWSVGGMFEGRRRIPGYYAHLVELGVRPHRLGKGSQLSRGKKKQTGAMHPGVPAHPFLRPAFEGTKQLAVRIAGEELGKAIVASAFKILKK